MFFCTHARHQSRMKRAHEPAPLYQLPSDVWCVVAEQLRVNGAAPQGGRLDKRDARTLTSLVRCSRQMNALFGQRVTSLALVWSSLRWCGLCRTRASDYDQVCFCPYRHTNRLCVACTVSLCSLCGCASCSNAATHRCASCARNFCARCTIREGGYHLDCGNCASCCTFALCDRPGIGVHRRVKKSAKQISRKRQAASRKYRRRMLLVRGRRRG